MSCPEPVSHDTVLRTLLLGALDLAELYFKGFLHFIEKLPLTEAERAMLNEITARQARYDTEVRALLAHREALDQYVRERQHRLDQPTET